MGPRRKGRGNIGKSELLERGQLTETALENIAL